VVWRAWQYNIVRLGKTPRTNLSRHFYALNMLLPASCLAFALSLIHSSLAQPRSYETSSFHPKDIIDRDVAIIGGGSSGTHAAISLKDKGKSIIVIEKQGRLGGHTETYDDPTTGTPIDYAVQVTPLKRLNDKTLTL
jgi:hypothetical protein